MELLEPLPPNRSLEQIKNHYLVEKAIAEKLKRANREERKLIYATMYDELFSQVPDHPRLTRRNDEQRTQRANESKLALVREYLNPSGVFVEFAPGDCKFVLKITSLVETVYAVDISDQRGPDHEVPENFSLIIYDGYQLDEIKRETVDTVFSDQFIEHLHPDDVRLHFELIHRILKPGGKYIFRTPHAFTGPHDISKFFSNEPQGFHLKEWTYGELNHLLKELKFSHVAAIRRIRGSRFKVPYFYLQICEFLLTRLSHQYKHALAQRLVPSIGVVATK